MPQTFAIPVSVDIRPRKRPGLLIAVAAILVILLGVGLLALRVNEDNQVKQEIQWASANPTGAFSISWTRRITEVGYIKDQYLVKNNSKYLEVYPAATQRWGAYCVFVNGGHHVQGPNTLGVVLGPGETGVMECGSYSGEHDLRFYLNRTGDPEWAEVAEFHLTNH